MRPILSPRARVRLRSPAEVGSASWTGGASAAALLLAFLRSLARGATATAVGAVVGWVVAFSSGPLVSPGSVNSGSLGLTFATVVGAALAACSFAVEAICGGRSSVLTSSFSSTTTLRGDELADAGGPAAVERGTCALASLSVTGDVVAEFFFGAPSVADFAQALAQPGAGAAEREFVAFPALVAPSSEPEFGELSSWATCVLA